MMQQELKIAALGDIADISVGHSIRGRVEYDPKGSHLLVQIKDVDPLTGIDPAGLVRFSPKGRKKPYLLGPDDLLFVGRGNRLFGLQVGRQLDNAVAAPHFFVIKANTSQVKPSYLAWYLNHTRAQQYFGQHATGSYITYISKIVLEELTVALPPLEKQEPIVRAYKCWLKEKDLSEQILHKKQQLITAILDSALGN